MNTMIEPNVAKAAGPASDTPNEALAQDLLALTRDAEALINSTAHSAGTAVDKARAQLQSRLQQVGSRLHELQHDAHDAVKESAHRADTAVHQHPYGAMVGAAAAGALVGFLLGRR